MRERKRDYIQLIVHIKSYGGRKDKMIYVDPVANLSTNDSLPGELERNSTSRQPLIFSVPLRGQGRKRPQIYSPPVSRETLHLVHHLLRSPSCSYVDLY